MFADKKLHEKLDDDNLTDPERDKILEIL